MRLRPPKPDDAEAVLGVLVARDVVDVGEPDYTLADLRDDWSATEFDLRADAVLAVTEEGGVLAYATVRRPGALVAVHPDHEGLGLGGQLLRWAERRELELGRARHRQWIGSANHAARRLLTTAGYRYARSYRRMVLALDAVDPDPPLPDGVGLRPLDVAADARRLHALDTASFAGNSDFQPESLQAFTEEHLEAHDADPMLSLVAVEGDRAVGFLLSRRFGDSVGFVDILAVHPDRQRRGVATAMLRRAFAQYSAAGLAEARLGVASDNPRAVSLYEGLGMRVRFRFDTYEKATAVVPG